jgi:hypothetical protein
MRGVAKCPHDSRDGWPSSSGSSWRTGRSRKRCPREYDPLAVYRFVRDLGNVEAVEHGCKRG